MDLPLYAYGNLAPGETRFGDLSRFVSLMARGRGQFDPVSLDQIRGNVRTRSMLNLLDVSLWGLAYGVVHDHVWGGEEGVRVPWLRIGHVRAIPATRSSVTPDWARICRAHPPDGRPMERRRLRSLDRTGRRYPTTRCRRDTSRVGRARHEAHAHRGFVVAQRGRWRHARRARTMESHRIAPCPGQPSPCGSAQSA